MGGGLPLSASGGEFVSVDGRLSMARKKLHDHSLEVNGHSYRYYRKAKSYRGRQFRVDAKDIADWEAIF